MNTLLAIFVCASVAIVSCAPQDKMMETKVKCQEETGASEEMVTNSFIGNFSDDPKLGKFYVCIAKRDGVVDADGHTHKDILKSKLMMFTSDEAAVDSALDKCLVENGTMEESAVAAAKCLFGELHK